MALHHFRLALSRVNTIITTINLPSSSSSSTAISLPSSFHWHVFVYEFTPTSAFRCSFGSVFFSV